jgi:aminoglycoside N3'-acetyltransferase
LGFSGVRSGGLTAFLQKFAESLSELMPPDNRPIVIFSAVWPFFRELKRADRGAVREILDIIADTAANRSVLMPTFSRGYVDGVCNLNEEPSTTGVISQEFLLRRGSTRTLSAFFSFAVSGAATSEVENLQPVDAWGDRSLYSWMQERNARFILLGTHPTHSSFLHRLEWLARDLIRYRYRKEFRGRILRNDEVYQCVETLYVRELKPEAVNDFTTLMGLLREAGMQHVRLNGISLAAYDAIPVVETILPQLLKDPFMVLANRNDFGG